MVRLINDILARFPEDEKAVRALLHENHEFAALCLEYAKTGEELDELTRLNKAGFGGLADALQERRTAVEEAILTRIEGYQPV
jgi:hypothetical protein